MSEILLCPYCSSPGEVIHTRVALEHPWQVYCTKCDDTHGPAARNPSAAIEQWNTEIRRSVWERVQPKGLLRYVGLILFIFLASFIVGVNVSILYPSTHYEAAWWKVFSAMGIVFLVSLWYYQLRVVKENKRILEGLLALKNEIEKRVK